MILHVHYNLSTKFKMLWSLLQPKNHLIIKILTYQLGILNTKMTPSSNVRNKTFCCFQSKTTKQIPQSCIYTFCTSLPLIAFELGHCMVLIFYKLSIIVITAIRRAACKSYISHNPVLEIQIYQFQHKNLSYNLIGLPWGITHIYPLSIKVLQKSIVDNLCKYVLARNEQMC